VYSVDVATGKVERWTFSETGGINTVGYFRAAADSLEIMG
jgi:hypothetical protein